MVVILLLLLTVQCFLPRGNYGKVTTVCGENIKFYYYAVVIQKSIQKLIKIFIPLPVIKSPVHRMGIKYSYMYGW